MGYLFLGPLPESSDYFSFWNEANSETPHCLRIVGRPGGWGGGE